MDQNQSLARHMSKSVISTIKLLLVACLVFAGLATSSISAATLVPGQITITSIVPSSGQLVVAWEITAPGGALTDVEFTTDNGTTWLTTGSATSPATITTTSRSATVGLQDGNYSHLEDLDNDAAIDDTIVGYALALRAVNASGQGAPSKRFEVIVGSSRTQPASIAAVTSGDRSLTLTLQHPVRATGVGCVQYSTNGGTTWSPLEAYSTTLTVVGLSTDQTTPLVNGTRYSVKVRYWDICGGNVGTAITALPGFGISGASATAYGTPSDVPAPSEIISITPRTTSLVVNAELGLTGGSPVTRLEYSTDGGTTWAPILPIPAALSGKLDTPGSPYSFTLSAKSSGGALDIDTSYSVTLRSMNIVGYSVASTAVTASTGGVPRPSEIVVIDSRATSLVVYAELGMSNGSTISRLEYSTDGGTTWAPILPMPAALSGKLDTPGTEYSFVISTRSVGGSLSIDTSYTVALRSRNSAGNSVASASVVASTSGVPRPSEIISIVPRAKSLVVNAELGMSGGATISALEYSTDDGVTWATILPIPAALLPTDLTVLGTKCAVMPALPPILYPATCKLNVPGTAYSFTISVKSSGGAVSSDASYTVALRSRNSAGNSVASASVTTSTAGSPRPSEIVSIAPRSNSLAVSAELGMAGGSVITRLDYTTDGGTTWAAILPIPAALSGKLDTPGSAYSFTITLKSSGGSLSPDTNYTVALRSANSAGNSSASASMVAETTGVGYLAPPSIDTVTVRNKSFIVKALLPTLPTGVSINRVEYSTDSGTTWRNSGQKTGSFIISLTSGGAVLTVGALYSIEVRLVTTAGNGLASETYQISAGNVSTPPVLYTASSNSGLITVSGTLGNTNGASITRLEYSTDNGVSWSTGMTLADVTTTPSAPAPTTTTTVASSSSTSTTAAPTTTTTVAASSSGGIPKNWTFVVSNISSSLGTPVQPGAVYLIKVRSVSAAGISGPSNAKAVTLAGSPRIPTILSATAANNSITLTISYAKTGGVSVTDVEYSTDDGASWKSGGDTANSLVITEESAAASSFLSPGELYIVRIRLIANGGVSGTSAPRSVRTTGTDSALTMEKLADKPLSLGSFDVKGEAKSKSGRTIVYASSTLATCSVTTTKVTLLKTGICTIVASIVADGEFKKDSVSKSFNITEVKEATLAVGEDITVNALAALQLPSKAPKAIVKATVVPASKNICTIKGSTISIVKAGVCKVKLVSKNKAGKAVSKVATITVKQ